MLFRSDSYKAAGYPEVKTLDDWIPVMKKMQENTPKSDSGKKTYAISLFKDWDGNMMVNAKNIASLYGYNELGFVLSKADGSDIQDITTDDGEYVKALRFLFKANQAGLVDPESTTQNYDILSNKYRDGQVLTSLWGFQGQSVYNTTEHKKKGVGFMPMFIEDSAPYSIQRGMERLSSLSAVRQKILRDWQILLTGSILRKAWKLPGRQAERQGLRG